MQQQRVLHRRKCREADHRDSRRCNNRAIRYVFVPVRATGRSEVKSD
jgi:hypothetical protein